MKSLVSNIILALTWALATGNFSPLNMLVGGVVGFAILLFVRPLQPKSRYFTKLGQAIGFSLFFLRELVVSSLRVAWDAVTPTHHMRPGIIAVPLSAENDIEIAFLANLLTLTPGTLSIDVSDDRKFLYVHIMYLTDDPDTVRRAIKDGFERKVIDLLR